MQQQGAGQYGGSMQQHGAGPHDHASWMQHQGTHQAAAFALSVAHISATEAAAAATAALAAALAGVVNGQQQSGPVTDSQLAAALQQLQVQGSKAAPPRQGVAGGHLRPGGRPESSEFTLVPERVLRGMDPRTTLMIRNIPNKYTQKMLLATIDAELKGTYDFFYLPIDFKNKCNVGYAFINLVDTESILRFYDRFNDVRWERFNSEKVASITYARIQGKEALVSHFRNSSLMNEDKRCRPIFSSR